MCSGAAAVAQRHRPRRAQGARVCQDPNNLPFSNTQGEGIENRIAEVFGKALGLPVTYYSFPQRLAFIRNTLRYKLPGARLPLRHRDERAGWLLTRCSVTKPYYRSTYALVFASGKGMDHVKSSEDFLQARQSQAQHAAHRHLRPFAGLRVAQPAPIWSNAACPTR